MAFVDVDLTALTPGGPVETDIAAISPSTSVAGGFGGTTPAGGMRQLDGSIKHVYSHSLALGGGTTDYEVRLTMVTPTTSNRSMAIAIQIQADSSCYFAFWADAANGWTMGQRGTGNFGGAYRPIGSTSVVAPPTALSEIIFRTENVSGNRRLTLFSGATQLLQALDSDAARITTLGKGGFAQENSFQDEASYATRLYITDELAANSSDFNKLIGQRGGRLGRPVGRIAA